MSKSVWLLAIVVGGGLLLLLLVDFVMWATDFCRELRYLRMEIGRTEGEERKYWRRRKRALWLSLLPFYR